MKRDKLRRMSTEQLDMLLQEELRKDTPDEEVVLPILEILESREQKPRRKRNWLISAAAVAAVLVLLITVVPRTVGADSIWDVILHLSDSVMQFFAPGAEPRTAESEYTFQTDNPGLQQLYDKVTELGITAPIVPMWIPDGYELAELKATSFDDSIKIVSVYEKNLNTIVITFKILDEISSTQYEKRRGYAETYERGGIGHIITTNDKKWTVAWVQAGAECGITLDSCKEDVYKVIDSIYRRN